MGPHTLSPGERELIATFVSARNDCRYCQTIHGAIAAHHLGGDEQLVVNVKSDAQHAAVSDKLKALLAIAGKVAEGGKRVTDADIARARAARAPPTSRSTTPCSSPRRSACSTATLTASPRGRPRIPISTVNAQRSWPRTDTPRPSRRDSSDDGLLSR